MKGIKNYRSCCNKAHSQLIHLDCAHSHCLFCLNQDIEANSMQEMLSDEVQIECRACFCLTVLPLSLVIKLARKLKVGQEKRAREGTKLICRRCMDGIFQLDDYIQGRHKDHQIQPIQKAYPFFKYISQQAEKSLNQRLTYLQALKQQTLRNKDILIEVMSKNIAQIKLEFNNIQHQLQNKENDVIVAYQQIMQAQIQGLQLVIQKVKEKIQRSEQYSREISQLMPIYPQIGPTYQEKLHLARYFIQNNESITEFTKQQVGNVYKANSLLIQQSRDLINVQGLSELINSIKDLSLLKIKYKENSRRKLPSRLGREYFDHKRSLLLDRDAISVFQKQQQGKDAGEVKVKEVDHIYVSKGLSPRSFIKLPQRK